MCTCVITLSSYSFYLFLALKSVFVSSPFFPFLKRFRTTSKWPLLAAQISAVSPLLVLTFTLAPDLKRHSANDKSKIWVSAAWQFYVDLRKIFWKDYFFGLAVKWPKICRKTAENRCWKTTETQLLENGRNIRSCRKTAEISAVFKQSEHVGTTAKEEGLKLLENGRNSGQIIRTETLLENTWRRLKFSR